MNSLVRVRRRLRTVARATRDRFLSDSAYWERRSRQLGHRAVFNSKHSDDELETVTCLQRQSLYPLLRQLLRGDERTALDLGCGTGRFTPDLAEMLDGDVVGTDPVAALIEGAPSHPRVQYRLMDPPRIPLDDASVDVVWICLVLGGIVSAQALSATVAEVERVLRPGGLLFVAENVAERPDRRRWVFRPAPEYCHLFPSIPLEVVGGYKDLGDPIAAFAGRRRTL